MITALGERRETGTNGQFQESAFPFGTFLFTSNTRIFPQNENVTSGYAELHAPLVSPKMHVRFISSLEFTAAIRHDDYKLRYSLPVSYTPGSPIDPPQYNRSNFSSTDYSFNGLYAPVAGVMFRGSFSTGMLPPKLIEFIPTTVQFGSDSISSFNILDPKRGNTQVLSALPVTVVGSPSLKPEQSKSFSVGLVLEPKLLPGFRLSADYVQIRKSGEITQLFSALGGSQSALANLVQNESLYPGRVIRGTLSPADAALGYTAGPIIGIDAGSINLAKTVVRAIDWKLDYTFTRNSLGTFRLYVVASQQLRRASSITPDSPLIDTVGFTAGPLKWRGNAGVDWSKNGWRAGWNVQYYDKYKVCAATDDSFLCDATKLDQGRSIVPSQMYHDLYITREFSGSGSSVLKNVIVTLGVQNIFNTEPPVIADGGVAYSTYADPRGRRITLELRRHF